MCDYVYSYPEQQHDTLEELKASLDPDHPFNSLEGLNNPKLSSLPLSPNGGAGNGPNSSGSNRSNLSSTASSPSRASRSSDLYLELKQSQQMVSELNEELAGKTIQVENLGI